MNKKELFEGFDPNDEGVQLSEEEIEKYNKENPDVDDALQFPSDETVAAIGATIDDDLTYDDESTVEPDDGATEKKYKIPDSKDMDKWKEIGEKIKGDTMLFNQNNELRNINDIKKEYDVNDRFIENLFEHNVDYFERADSGTSGTLYWINSNNPEIAINTTKLSFDNGNEMQMNFSAVEHPNSFRNPIDCKINSIDDIKNKIDDIKSKMEVVSDKKSDEYVLLKRELIDNQLIEKLYSKENITDFVNENYKESVYLEKELAKNIITWNHYNPDKIFDINNLDMESNLNLYERLANGMKIEAVKNPLYLDISREYENAKNGARLYEALRSENPQESLEKMIENGSIKNEIEHIVKEFEVKTFEKEEDSKDKVTLDSLKQEVNQKRNEYEKVVKETAEKMNSYYKENIDKGVKHKDVINSKEYKDLKSKLEENKELRDEFKIRNAQLGNNPSEDIEKIKNAKGFSLSEEKVQEIVNSINETEIKKIDIENVKEVLVEKPEILKEEVKIDVEKIIKDELISYKENNFDLENVTDKNKEFSKEKQELSSKIDDLKEKLSNIENISEKATLQKELSEIEHDAKINQIKLETNEEILKSLGEKDGIKNELLSVEQTKDITDFFEMNRIELTPYGDVENHYGNANIDKKERMNIVLFDRNNFDFKVGFKREINGEIFFTETRNGLLTKVDNEQYEDVTEKIKDTIQSIEKGEKDSLFKGIDNLFKDLTDKRLTEHFDKDSDFIKTLRDELRPFDNYLKNEKNTQNYLDVMQTAFHSLDKESVDLKKEFYNLTERDDTNKDFSKSEMKDEYVVQNTNLGKTVSELGYKGYIEIHDKHEQTLHDLNKFLDVARYERHHNTGGGGKWASRGLDIGFAILFVPNVIFTKIRYGLPLKTAFNVAREFTPIFSRSDYHSDTERSRRNMIREYLKEYKTETKALEKFEKVYGDFDEIKEILDNVQKETIKLDAESKEKYNENRNNIERINALKDEINRLKTEKGDNKKIDQLQNRVDKLLEDVKKNNKAIENNNNKIEKINKNPIKRLMSEKEYKKYQNEKIKLNSLEKSLKDSKDDKNEKIQKEIERTKEKISDLEKVKSKDDKVVFKAETGDKPEIDKMEGKQFIKDGQDILDKNVIDTDILKNEVDKVNGYDSNGDEVKNKLNILDKNTESIKDLKKDVDHKIRDIDRKLETHQIKNSQLKEFETLKDNLEDLSNKLESALKDNKDAKKDSIDKYKEKVGTSIENANLEQRTLQKSDKTDNYALEFEKIKCDLIPKLNRDYENVTGEKYILKDFEQEEKIEKNVVQPVEEIPTIEEPVFEEKVENEKEPTPEIIENFDFEDDEKIVEPIEIQENIDLDKVDINEDEVEIKEETEIVEQESNFIFDETETIEEPEKNEEIEPIDDSSKEIQEENPQEDFEPELTYEEIDIYEVAEKIDEQTTDVNVEVDGTDIQAIKGVKDGGNVEFVFDKSVSAKEMRIDSENGGKIGFEFGRTNQNDARTKMYGSYSINGVELGQRIEHFTNVNNLGTAFDYAFGKVDNSSGEQRKGNGFIEKIIIYDSNNEIEKEIFNPLEIIDYCKDNFTDEEFNKLLDEGRFENPNYEEKEENQKEDVETKETNELSEDDTEKEENEDEEDKENFEDTLDPYFDDDIDF